MALVMPDGRPQPMDQGQYQTQGSQGSPWDPYNASIQQSYQTHLNRQAAPEELALHHNNNPYGYADPSLLKHAQDNIANSEEARNRRAQAPPQQNAPPQGNASGGGQPAAPGVPQVYAQGPNLSSMMSSAQSSAPTINSQYNSQQIRDFTGKNIVAPNYTQTVFSQFQDPRNQQTQENKDQLLNNLLQNPQSLSQTWQDQMFEKQKEEALSFAQQMGLQNQQGLVGRGNSLFGGVAQGQQTDLNASLAEALLGGRRDIATQAATQNRADELNALQAGEQGLSGDVNRGSQVFQNYLAGQSAQADDNRYATDYGLRSQQAVAGNERDNYASYLGGRNLQGTENARAEQFRQSAFGLSNQSRQNAAQQALQAYMAQDGSELGWANYGLNADDQFLRFLGGQ
jgi:hypothetical protein